MKKASLGCLILTSVIAFLALNVVRATSEKTTFAITTGEIELAGGVKVKVDLDFPVLLNYSFSVNCLSPDGSQAQEGP